MYRSIHKHIYIYNNNNNNIKDGDYFCYSEFYAILRSSDRCNTVVTTSLIYKSPSWNLYTPVIIKVFLLRARSVVSV